MVRAPNHPDAPTRVGEVMSTKDTRLAGLVKYANSLSRLETLLAGIADPELASQFQVAAIRENRLILVTPTASWATRLRMHSETLLNGLQGTAFSQLMHIDIRVAPLSREPAPKRLKKNRSPAAELALKHMRQLIGSEPPSSKPRPDGES